jgi:hypothetical protein
MVPEDVEKCLFEQRRKEKFRRRRWRRQMR